MTLSASDAPSFLIAVFLLPGSNSSIWNCTFGLFDSKDIFVWTSELWLNARLIYSAEKAAIALNNQVDACSQSVQLVDQVGAWSLKKEKTAQKFMRSRISIDVDMIANIQGSLFFNQERRSICPIGNDRARIIANWLKSIDWKPLVKRYDIFAFPGWAHGLEHPFSKNVPHKPLR